MKRMIAGYEYQDIDPGADAIAQIPWLCSSHLLLRRCKITNSDSFFRCLNTSFKPSKPYETLS